MKIYIVQRSYDYEGSEVDGVFEDAETAMRFAAAEMLSERYQPDRYSVTEWEIGAAQGLSLYELDSDWRRRQKAAATERVAAGLPMHCAIETTTGAMTSADVSWATEPEGGA